MAMGFENTWDNILEITWFSENENNNQDIEKEEDSPKLNEDNFSDAQNLINEICNSINNEKERENIRTYLENLYKEILESTNIEKSNTSQLTSLQLEKQKEFVERVNEFREVHFLEVRNEFNEDEEKAEKILEKVEEVWLENIEEYYSISEIKRAYDELNFTYNLSRKSNFSYLATDDIRNNISELYVKLTTSENTLAWYNEALWNYSMTVSQFEKQLATETDIKEINSLMLANYFEKFWANSEALMKKIQENFSPELLQSLKEIWQKMQSNEKSSISVFLEEIWIEDKTWIAFEKIKNLDFWEKIIDDIIKLKNFSSVKTLSEASALIWSVEAENAYEHFKQNTEHRKILLEMFSSNWSEYANLSDEVKESIAISYRIEIKSEINKRLKLMEWDEASIQIMNILETITALNIEEKLKEINRLINSRNNELSEEEKVEALSSKELSTISRKAALSSIQKQEWISEEQRNILTSLYRLQIIAEEDWKKEEIDNIQNNSKDTFIWDTNGDQLENTWAIHYSQDQIESMEEYWITWTPSWKAKMETGWREYLFTDNESLNSYMSFINDIWELWFWEIWQAMPDILDNLRNKNITWEIDITEGISGREEVILYQVICKMFKIENAYSLRSVDEIKRQIKTYYPSNETIAIAGKAYWIYEDNLETKTWLTNAWFWKYWHTLSSDLDKVKIG